MKKSRNKIVIKTRKGGYTKLYANSKWQKKVYNIDYHAAYISRRIKVNCEFDKYKTDKNGSVIFNRDKAEFLSEHCSIMI